jgi:hypothetical protein
MKPTLERHAIDVDRCDRKTVSLIALEKGPEFSAVVKNDDATEFEPLASARRSCGFAL